MTACVGQPISWLLLERYQLGELERAQASHVERHLTSCPACSECLSQIDEPLELPELPALPDAPVARPRPKAALETVPWWRRLRAWLALPGALAAAAVAVLLMLRSETPELPGARVRIKGGELALSLVRERTGAVTFEPLGFAQGDRFALLLTCPPGGRVHSDVVVYQDGQAYFPLPAGELTCQNRARLPGAFSLDGDRPAAVCVAIAEGELDRGRLATGPQALPPEAVCEELQPE